MSTHYPYNPDMPVSAKFYARLVERIRTILVDCQFSDTSCANRERRILYLINKYLCPKGSFTRPNGDDPVCNIIFQTLRAEIDAAVERSRRARARAAARRAAKAAWLSDNSDGSDSSEKSDQSERSDRPEKNSGISLLEIVGAVGDFASKKVVVGVEREGALPEPDGAVGVTVHEVDVAGMLE